MCNLKKKKLWRSLMQAEWSACNGSGTERFCIFIINMIILPLVLFISPLPTPTPPTHKELKELKNEFPTVKSVRRYFSPHLCERPPEAALWPGTRVPIFLLPPKGFLLPTGPRPASHRNCSCLLQQTSDFGHTKVDWSQLYPSLTIFCEPPCFFVH